LTTTQLTKKPAWESGHPCAVLRNLEQSGDVIVSFTTSNTLGFVQAVKTKTDLSSLHSGTSADLSRSLTVIAATSICAAVPVSADDVGVGVKAGPVGAGVTVGEDHRDRDRERTTVIKEREREPRDTTVIRSATGNLIVR
jgi:hypothetical protein